MPRPLIHNRPQAITRAARELALEHGWEHTTIEAIAKRAGIGKGAVYREFSDKTQILTRLLTTSGRQLVTTVHDRVRSTPGLVGLGDIYRFGTEALLADPLMTAFYLRDSRILGRYVQEVTDDRYLARFGWLTDYIAQLQQAGVIADTPTPQTIALTLSMFTIGLINTTDVLGTTSADELKAALDLFADILENGLTGRAAPDQHLARAAQQSFLDRLATQLDDAQGTRT